MSEYRAKTLSPGRSLWEFATLMAAMAAGALLVAPLVALFVWLA